MGLNVSRKDLVLACLSAVLLIPSFPRFDLNGLAWVGLVPLLVALEGKRLRAAFGLSFLIVLCNALVADTFRYWRHCRCLPTASSPLPRSLVLSAVIVSVLLISTYVYGRWTLAQPLSDERIRIAVIQGNIPQQSASRSAIIDRYSALTRKAAQGTPALIVWPETAVPSDIKHDPTLRRKIDALALETAKV